MYDYEFVLTGRTDFYFRNDSKILRNLSLSQPVVQQPQEQAAAKEGTV